MNTHAKNFLTPRLQLYVVTDERADTSTFLTLLREAIAGGATAIQLRRKNDDGRKFVELGRAIRSLTQELGVLYFVNDRVDVALLTDADGVHLGQTDISCKDARQLIGSDKIIGISASSVSEAKIAWEEGADYLGVGAIYPTSSKEDADICGLNGLRTIAAHSPLPIVAIGGITASNAPESLRAGANGVAVVSSIMRAFDPKQATEQLLQSIHTTLQQINQ